MYKRQLKGWRCEVTWTWGGAAGWKRLFAETGDVEVTGSRTSETGLKTVAFAKGGREANRALDAAASSDRCVLRSCHAFSWHDLPPFLESDLRRYAPSPAAEIREKADAFVRRHFRPGMVGVHIRATDNAASRNGSPLHFFEERIRLLSETGTPVFLAADSPETIARMRRIPGAAITVLEKVIPSKNRWPNPRVSEPSLVEDYLDLLLLARCDFVLGSHGSSYTDLAVAFNGDPRCERLGKRNVPAPGSFDAG